MASERGRSATEVLPSPIHLQQHLSGLPLPYVYEPFPELLQPVTAFSDEFLQATRAVRWHERAERIADDVKCWSQSVKEWKRVTAEMEGDPTISRERREGTIEAAKKHSNWELRNLGRRIYFESNAEERARMLPTSASVFDIISGGRAEAKTPAGKARWECLNGRTPTSVPPPPEPVDPLPYLSPRPGLTYEGGGRFTRPINMSIAYASMF
ncbi:uncharacterized protein LOC125525680 [Triticum urartu]|uniref:uncharacterized protein LOC125525680 n=1 Tax=Triticum urartu TaxID=4572 RepID=UPI0020431677|nr:uncharacterized protein LOC125525680 [Triticum urartu]